MRTDASALFETIALITGVLVVLHAVVNVVLIRILNPIFDPDWRGAVSAGGLRAAYGRALGYSGAVATRRGRRTFGDPSYDFRARVGPVTRLLCQLNVALIGLAIVGLLVYGGRQLWVHFQGVPTPR